MSKSDNQARIIKRQEHYQRAAQALLEARALARGLNVKLIAMDFRNGLAIYKFTPAKAPVVAAASGE